MSQVTASFNRPTPLNPTKAVLVQYVSALIDDNSVNFWTKDSLGAPEAIPDHFFQQTVAMPQPRWVCYCWNSYLRGEDSSI